MLWKLWITMWKLRSPNKNLVDKSVDKCKSFPHFPLGDVENLLIHRLSTLFQQLRVDNQCSCSVRIAKIIFPKHKFFQTQFPKKSLIYLSSYCFPFIIMFFTLSTISLVFVFSFTSFSIFLHPCITVE